MKHAFSINICFVLLIILGCSVLPFISVQLLPTQDTNSLTITYDWDGALAEVVEKEVTSKLEGLASTLQGVTKITSKSSNGKGVIHVTLDEEASVKHTKFELNALIRASYKTLPEAVSLPRVTERGYRDNNTQKIPLLYYTVSGNGSAYTIQKQAQQIFETQLSRIEGVESVLFYGAVPNKWELIYNADKLKHNQLTTNDIITAIRSGIFQQELGYGLSQTMQNKIETSFITLKGALTDSLELLNVPVAKVGDRIIHIRDVAKANYVPQEQQRFSRIDGRNNVNMIVFAEQHVNQIELANLVKREIARLQKAVPPTFSLLLARDTTEDLAEEINTVIMRIATSLSLILLLVLIISRKWRYLFIIIASLIANLCIAFIFYYSLKLSISIYALAGITVSFGIMVDNSILMLDHIRYKKNKNVFLAILAATLTTVGALSVVFFLEDNLKANLYDFAIVISINLFASLIVALFFIPALLDVLPLTPIPFKRLLKRKKRIVKFTKAYAAVIYFCLRFKKTLVVISILGFGLPVFWLPYSLSDDSKFATAYNAVFSNETYETLRPYVDKALGGALRLFTEVDFTQPLEDDKGRSRLSVRIYLPDGAIVQQTNTVARKVEAYLAQFKEIEHYFTRISNVENARIDILFKPEHDATGFPEYLKEELIVFASNIGGCDMSISGVGTGFSNKTNDAVRNSVLQLKGYNYETLLRYAENAKQKLLENPRVQKAIINTGRKRYRDKIRHEYVMHLDKEKLMKNNTSEKSTIRGLSELTYSTKTVAQVIQNNEFIPIELKPEQHKANDIWHINHVLNKNAKLKAMGRLEKEPSKGTISKINQEFNVTVEYDYIGSYTLGKRIMEKNVNSLNEQLPMGFSAKEKTRALWKPEEAPQYWLILLVIAIIYVVCAIVLESLLQPLIIVLTIPLSFIGVFLTFSQFKLSFDQGGYASLLLLCGLLVNAALYIINDYNNQSEAKSKSLKTRNYLKAYNTKIIPILLTVLSTVLGLIPFLFSAYKDPFWFALAAGTMGGLVFSVLVIIIYLPLFMFWRLPRTTPLKVNNTNSNTAL